MGQNYGLEERCEPCDETTRNNYGLIDSIAVAVADDRCGIMWGNADGGGGSYVKTEDPYTLRVCQETLEFGYRPDQWYSWSDRVQTIPGYDNVSTAINKQYNRTAEGPLGCPGDALHYDKDAADNGRCTGANKASNKMNGAFMAKECPKCMRPVRLWWDAIYWSLTTMTTIGYGDRGPVSERAFPATPPRKYAHCIHMAYLTGRGVWKRPR
jgi:hypothetical protein